MTDAKTIYRERTPWPGWVGAIYWGAVGILAALLLVGYDTDLSLSARLPLVLVILAVGAGLARVIGGLTVEVQETRLFLYLGSHRLFRRAVSFAEILDLETTEYRPIADFGGWGARGTGNRRAWTARGNRAVLLHLTEGRELYVGSDHPQRLEERIRTVAGEALGGGDRLPGM